MTNNSDINFIIETAKEVGLEVDENTALNFGFIKEVIKRTYGKGYHDGMKALKFHRELCKEEQTERRINERHK